MLEDDDWPLYVAIGTSTAAVRMPPSVLPSPSFANPVPASARTSGAPVAGGEPLVTHVFMACSPVSTTQCCGPLLTLVHPREPASAPGIPWAA